MLKALTPVAAGVSPARAGFEKPMAVVKPLGVQLIALSATPNNANTPRNM